MLVFKMYFQGEPLKWPTEYIEVDSVNIIDAYNTLTQEQKDRIEFVTSEEDVYSKHYLDNYDKMYIEELPF